MMNSRVDRSPTPALAAVDHLLLGVSDLEFGIDWVEKTVGVRAAVGGSHPGRGTCNALLALSGRQYLEIIAPDPAQPEGARSELRELQDPRLITWAAATNDIGAIEQRVRAAGLTTPGPRPGSRARPDGGQLTWTTLSIETKFALGVAPIPFFIEWHAASVHPSRDSPKGCELLTLAFEHPDADLLSRTLERIGIDATVRRSELPRILATLNTPNGRVVLT